MIRTDRITIAATPRGYELSFRLIIDFAGLCPQVPFNNLIIVRKEVDKHWGHCAESGERYTYISLTAPTAAEAIERYEQWCRNTFPEILSKARFVQEQTVRAFSLEKNGRLRADEQVIKVSPPLPAEGGK